MLGSSDNKQKGNIVPSNHQLQDPTQIMDIDEFAVGQFMDAAPLQRSARRYQEDGDILQIMSKVEALSKNDTQAQFLEKQKKPLPPGPARPGKPEDEIPLFFESEYLQQSMPLLVDGRIEVDTKITQKGKTLLHLAAEFGEEYTVRYLISKGADVNKIDSEGAGALELAVAFGYINIARDLLEAGANVDATNPYNNDATALYTATKNEDLPMMQLLIDFGADVELSATGNFSPLYVTAETVNLDGVKLLLRAGADPTKSNDEGFTALYLACDTNLNENPNIAIELIHALHERDNVDDRARLAYLIKSSLIERNGKDWGITDSMFSLITNLMQSNNERAVLALQRLCDVGDFVKHHILDVKKQWDEYCEENGIEKNPALDVMEEEVVQPNATPSPARGQSGAAAVLEAASLERE